MAPVLNNYYVIVLLLLMYLCVNRRLFFIHFSYNYPDEDEIYYYLIQVR